MSVIVIVREGKQVEGIAFPPTRAGEVKRVEVELYNTGQHFVSLTPSFQDEDLYILEYPKTLEPKKTGKVIAEFRPKKDRVVPLNTSIDVETVIG